MRFLTIFAALAAAAVAGEPDVAAIRTELSAAIKARTTDDESFARKLETWYAAFGQTIRIDHPRENIIYLFGVTFATAPDAALPGLLRQMGGAADRAGILAHYLQSGNLTALPFDRQEWLRKPLRGRTRYRMFKTFLDQHPPIAQPQPQIEAILGPADSSYANIFTYDLGPDLSAFGIDNLRVEFTLKDGKVAEHRFYSD